MNLKDLANKKNRTPLEESVLKVAYLGYDKLAASALKELDMLRYKEPKKVKAEKIVEKVDEQLI